MERTLDNRPPSVFCLILKSQNLTETLQIEIRDIMIALPLKAYTDCIWCDVCVYAQNCCFICGRAPVSTQSVGHISSHINLFLPGNMRRGPTRVWTYFGNKWSRIANANASRRYPITNAGEALVTIHLSCAYYIGTLKHLSEDIPVEAFAPAPCERGVRAAALEARSQRFVVACRITPPQVTNAHQMAPASQILANM